LPDAVSRAVWLGRVEVRPTPDDPDALEGAVGAIVNVLAPATGPADYRKRVEESSGATGLAVVDFEDIRQLEPPYDVEAAELREGARRVAETGEVFWGTFYSYDSEVEQ
jgi:hypothetical protein